MAKPKNVIPASDITKRPDYLESDEEKFLNPYANEITALTAPVSNPAFEKVWENQNNAGITLGMNYDKKSPTETGIGIVDICTGRVANRAQIQNEEGTVETVPIDSVIEGETVLGKYSYGISEKDAARVFVAQRTDVDKVFGLYPFGAKGSTPGRSAVAIKADAVRIISRDAGGGVKIMVKQDPDQQNAEKLSAAGQAGVELIAGGKMEPMVKADSLALVLTDMLGFLSKLQTQMLKFYETQMEFNAQVAMEMNPTPYYTAPTICDPNNPKALGKSACDLLTEVCEASRKLAIQLGLFELDTLGTTRPGASEENPYTPPAVIASPSFASIHHKLD